MDREVVLKALKDALASATDEKTGTGDVLGDAVPAMDQAVPAMDQAVRLLEGPVNGWGPRVTGRCPSCRNASLFVGSGGHVTCAVLGCKAPDAPTKLLDGELYPALERVQLQDRARQEWGLPGLVATLDTQPDHVDRWTVMIGALTRVEPLIVGGDTEVSAWRMALKAVRHFKNPEWRGGGDVGVCWGGNGSVAVVDDLVMVDCRLCFAEVQAFIDSRNGPATEAP